MKLQSFICSGKSFVATKENERLDYLIVMLIFLLHQTIGSFIGLNSFLVEQCWLVILHQKITRTTLRYVSWQI